ncbi:MAG: FAD-dependent oxidoreductase, partial [Clostridia bacterium]
IDAPDIAQAKVFDDWAVTKAHFNFDVHNLSGNGLDDTGSQKQFQQKSGYTIPYGCLVPQKIDGLLLAGRDICGTHLAHSNYRVMPICANMGQAAAVAASLCIQQGIRPRELDVAKLQARLNKLGVTP